MKLINIGFGNMVAAGRVLAVVSPDSAPIKRVIQEARDRTMLIDASYGRKTKSVLLMDTDHVILSAIGPETICERAQDKQGTKYEEDDKNSKGNLFVFSGASGVGKSTVLSKVMNARSDLCFSVSATTRAPRQGEEQGVHYYFVTVDEFQDMIAGNQMLEYDFHNDTFYGTPKQQLDEGREKRCGAGCGAGRRFLTSSRSTPMQR